MQDFFADVLTNALNNDRIKEKISANALKKEEKMRLDRYKLLVKMAKKDMTTVRLAEIAGVSRMTISGVRCGKSCTAKTAGKIAQALGVDVTEIMGDE